MLTYRVLALVGIAVGVLIVWTQIVWPCIRGRSMFPILRRRRRALTAAAVDVNDMSDDARLASEVQRAAAELTPPPAADVRITPQSAAPEPPKPKPPKRAKKRASK